MKPNSSQPKPHERDKPAPQNYHKRRTASWNHWGIFFLDIQPDIWKNYGEPAAKVFFPVGPRGPVDIPRRVEYEKMIKRWVEEGVLPDEAVSP